MRESGSFGRIFYFFGGGCGASGHGGLSCCLSCWLRGGTSGG
jgi:hypothetical protein